MNHKIKLCAVWLFIILIFFACNSKEAIIDATQHTETKPIKQSKQTSKSVHSYGGWFCPDNLKVFPAVDVRNLNQVPVVMGRLPTRQETMEGKSLIYIDPTIYPTAKPLEMPLPRLARCYSKFTKKNELVVIIQAVVIDQDSIVGFRYLNGGNGSAWLEEVTFVSEEEQAQLGSTPFVDQGVVINAFPKIIWEVITSPAYAKLLGEMFDKGSFIESEWKNGAEVHFKYEPDKTVSTGIITVIWKNLYIQIDYDFDGYHYVEKILLLENKEKKHTEFRVSAGPYGADYVAQKLVWHNWLNKVKDLSERKMNLENYFGLGLKF